MAILMMRRQGVEPTCAELEVPKRLREMGHRVSVLPAPRKTRLLRDCPPPGAETADGIKVPSIPPPSRRPASATSAAVSALLSAKPDVVFVYSTPSSNAQPASLIKWLRNVPYVQHIQDCWPEGPANLGRFSGERSGRLSKLRDRSSFRGAARLVVRSTTAQAALLGRGCGEEQIALIPGSATEKHSSSEDERYPLAHTANEAAFDPSHLQLVLEQSVALKPWTLAGKRLTDIVVAAGLLAISAVPMASVAILVRMRLGSPVMFRQTRPGQFGRPFEMLKFRTMTDSTDAQGNLLPDRDRLTIFGGFLRQSSLDELPSLVNVLKGDMSLVGPRPLLERYTEWFKPHERQRLHVRPGITGLAQVRGRNLVGWDERLAADVEYVQALSMLQDVKILLATFVKVFRRSGAIADPESVMQNLDDERRDTGGVPS